MNISLKDNRGVPVSTTSLKSLERLEQACDLMNGYFNDPFAVIDEALAEDPQFIMGHCFRAAFMATATDKTFLPEIRRSVEAAEALAGKANDRERGHIAGARAWLESDYDRVADHYQRVLLDHPRDLMALQLVHLRDFLTGQAMMLRDRPARTMPAWDESVPGYNYVLGMHAFGLEESGDYARAEERGRQAVALQPRDSWAVHAVAHVLEMQNRTSEGIDWINRGSDYWSGDNGFAYHNWWHLALFHLDRGDTAEVLALYDRLIRNTGSTMPMELIDAAALLWRLHLMGVGVGQRWKEVADKYEATAEDGHYAFNDLHAMFAFAAEGRTTAAERLLATLARRAEATDWNGIATRTVGLPLAQAIDAFAKGRYAQAVETLLRVRPIAYRFGGSHAQRDILSLTLVEAALRGGQGQVAQAMAGERTELKPLSGVNRLLAQRAAGLAKAA